MPDTNPGSTTATERRIVNPWTWQDAYGFVQANDVIGARRVLYCSGQLAADADGSLLHPDDMKGQIGQSLDNLETVLKAAGLTLANIVRLNYYTTDVDAFIEAMGGFGERLAAAGCRPAATLLGVTRLAFVGQVVEFEATAVE
jgi:enamine deaminase RidA (YjgF/YER057c/UK114 family)